MEASLISERTKQALAMSENKGGRPRLDSEIKLKVYEMYRSQQYTVNELAKYFKISRSSVYRIIQKNNKG